MLWIGLAFLGGIAVGAVGVFIFAANAMPPLRF